MTLPIELIQIVDKTLPVDLLLSFCHPNCRYDITCRSSVSLGVIQTVDMTLPIELIQTVDMTLPVGLLLSWCHPNCRYDINCRSHPNCRYDITCRSSVVLVSSKLQAVIVEIIFNLEWY